MFVLAFDTSSTLVTAAVAGPDGVVEREELVANRHGELLAPMIDDLLARANVTPAELAAVGVGVGPGPFTGLRVGVVTAAVLSDALRIPAYGVCSLDVIAQAHAPSPGGFLVASDARRRQVYWAHYSASGDRLAGPDVDRPEAVAESFRGSVRTVVGAGALLHRSCFDGFDIVEADPYPHARDLDVAAAARASARQPGDVLEPMYLRRPDARPPGPPKKVTPC